MKALVLATASVAVFHTALGAAPLLSLDEAQRLAETGQPLLQTRQATADAAREAAIAARQLPDPKLRLGIQNLPVEGPEAYTIGQDSMTMRMVGVMQEFPRQAKRELRSEVVLLEGERSERELAFARLQVRRDAALAWLDVWSALQAAKFVQGQRAETARQIEALLIALRNNRSSAADVSTAKVELELLGDREQMLRGEERAARAMLARWIGPHGEDPLPETLPASPIPEVDALLANLDAHPHLVADEVQVKIANTQAQLARLSTRPDWNLELSYQKRGSAFSDMVSLQLGIDLPIFQTNRQDRTVAAKLAEADAARATREDNLREMRADVQRLHAAWDVADKRTAIFRERVLPEAGRRLEHALAAYRAGRGTLFEALAARRALLDAQLEHLMRQVETARAAVALDYFARFQGVEP